MAQLLVRNLDEGVKSRLHLRAARHNRSLEAEVRIILTEASASSADDPVGRLLAAVHDQRVEPNLPDDSFDHEGATFE